MVVTNSRITYDGNTYALTGVTDIKFELKTDKQTDFFASFTLLPKIIVGASVLSSFVFPPAIIVGAVIMLGVWMKSRNQVKYYHEE